MKSEPLRTPVRLSLILPCYNESPVLPSLHERLRVALGALPYEWEVIFVDDGSTDGSWEKLSALSEADPRFKVIRFSRNFGQQAAITCGLEYAGGEIVGVMDADLQDPPEILTRCAEKLEEGYDVVYAVRRGRKEGWLLRSCYSLFYKLFRTTADIDVPVDAGDFCVMTRPVAEALRQMPERNLFVRGMRAWVGFRQVGLEYERPERAAGTSKYPLGRLWRLATDGMFAFSTVPLRIATWMGFAMVGFVIALSGLILIWRLAGFRLLGHTSTELPGWTAVALGILMLGGVQLLFLGLIGEYVGRIYSEVKARPRWVVRQTRGFPPVLDRHVTR